MSRNLCLAGVLGLATLLAACGDEAVEVEVEKKSVSERAGQALGDGVTDFLSGVGSGIDQQMLVQAEADAALAPAGLEMTVAKARGLGDVEKGVTVYLIAAKAFEGRLRARALNAQAQEVGRAHAEVALQERDAAYVEFIFPQAMDSQLVQRYRIELAR